MKTITKFLFALVLLVMGASNIQADMYVFSNVEDNRWHNLKNWLVAPTQGDGIEPERLPTIDDYVYICDDVVIDSAAFAKTINMNGGRIGSIDGPFAKVKMRITAKGGLTVGEGGIFSVPKEYGKYDPTLAGNVIIIENISGVGAGYLRIHPEATDIPEGVVVEYTTAAGPGDYSHTNQNKDRLWQYVGAPGLNTVLDLDERTWLYEWSELEGWRKADGNMIPFDGYTITHTHEPSHTYTWYTTPIIGGEHAFELTYIKDGYNVIANSFLAPINLSAFTAEDFYGNVDRTFYLFNTGSWNQWQSSTSIGNDLSKQSPGQYTAIPILGARNFDQEADPILIAPMQGLFVIAGPTDYIWGSGITLNYEKHIWKPEIGNVAMRAPQQSTLLRRIRIQAFGENSGSDRMYIMEDKNCTPGYDNGYDAKNMLADEQLSIYTNESCGKMEVSSTNDMDGMYIGFQASVDTVYTLRFSSLIGEALYIKDLANGNMIELVDDATYTFTAKPHSVNNMRFQVLVDPFMTGEGNGNTTDVDNVQSSNTFWMSDSHICVSTNQANSVATIYNVSGQMIMNVPFNNQIEIPTHNFSTGVYILQTNNERYKFIID